ncbi:site-specific tyrosine recombinase/integron integrase [Urechidicola croceus]|uniref:Integrase n=1 Tax=Urechidicola croceus TaxID=1850246 RepID=A0A1D8P476_9FLAO|nr:site-specific tyrosine recombinase/integron integrase [Urechidicola croceus]AOW19393.1 integrase [Urechidicola croceus]
MNNTTITSTLVLKKVIHRKNVQLLLQFPYNDFIINKIRSLKLFAWSKTHRGWYSEFSTEKVELLENTFNKEVQVILDPSIHSDISIKPKRKNRKISEENKEFIRGYVKYLKGKRYSESTVNTYFYFVADFIEYIKDKPLNELNNRDVEKFIEDVFSPKKYSISTQRQLISAIKLLVKYYPNCSIDEIKLSRPKKSRILPSILSKEEVINLLRCTKNLKHRAILAMIYSSGLRIGELINLKLSNIDIDRRQIIVQNGKNRKDRNVIMAESMIPLIMNYVQTYRPTFYFVEGEPNKKYSASSIRAFLKRSCKNAGIVKRVTPHTLRHSYATHLLENGIDIRYIQELLGHAKTETTMIYTHVSKKDLLKIESPLDLAVKQLNETDNHNKKLRLSGKY